MTTQTRREIVVRRSNLRSCSYYLIHEIPVQHVFHCEIPLSVDWRERGMCSEVLRSWAKQGCVVLFKKQALIEVACEQHDSTVGFEKRILESLIRNGIFREEDGWLIPLKPILKCATDHVVPRNFPSCLVRTHYDVAISIQ